MSRSYYNEWWEESQARTKERQKERSDAAREEKKRKHAFERERKRQADLQSDAEPCSCDSLCSNCVEFQMQLNQAH